MILPILAARTGQTAYVENATVSETCAVFLALPGLSFMEKLLPSSDDALQTWLE
jgi:hypothetical protein